MHEVMEFLKTNWPYILACIALVVDIVFLIIASKKTTKTTIFSSITEILLNLPNYIIEAESLGSKTGFSKLVAVLAIIKRECEKHQIKYDEAFWQEKIENILSTPQKKEN